MKQKCMHGDNLPPLPLIFTVASVLCKKKSEVRKDIEKRLQYTVSDGFILNSNLVCNIVTIITSLFYEYTMDRVLSIHFALD